MNILNFFLNTRSSKSLVGYELNSNDFLIAKKVLFSMFSRYGDFFATLSVIKEYEKQYAEKQIAFIIPHQMSPYIRRFFPNAALITVNKRNPISLLIAILKLKKFSADIGLNPWSHGADSEFFISFTKKFMFYKKEMKKYQVENLYDKPRLYMKLSLPDWGHVQPNLEKTYDSVIICPESSDIEKSMSVENIAYVIENIKIFSPKKVCVAATKKYFDKADDVIDIGVERIILRRGSSASREFLNKMQSSNLVVTADSGPMHLAYILNKDTIAYFSKTVPEWVIDANANIYIQRDARMRDKYCQYADNGMCKTMECMKANFRGSFLKEYIHSDPTSIKRGNYCLVDF